MGRNTKTLSLSRIPPEESARLDALAEVIWERKKIPTPPFPFSQSSLSGEHRVLLAPFKQTIRTAIPDESELDIRPRITIKNRSPYFKG